MAFGNKKPGGAALVISMGPGKPGADEMAGDDTESMEPGVNAAKALISAVKGGNAQDVWAAFQELLATADSAEDEAEGEEPEMPEDDGAEAPF